MLLPLADDRSRLGIHAGSIAWSVRGPSRAAPSPTLTPDPRLPHHPSVDRRHFLLTSLAGALAGPLAADAQPAEKVYRVGLLSADTPRTQDLAQSAFVKTLRELGWVEGRNLLLEERLAMTTEQLDVLAAERNWTARSPAWRSSESVAFSSVLMACCSPSERVLAELALKHRLPAMYSFREHAEAGGLMAYSADWDVLRRRAVFVDKILKGARPFGAAHRATQHVRVRHQSHGRPGARPHNPAVAVGAGGSGD